MSYANDYRRTGDILVVDDDPDIANLLVEFLGSEGFAVRTAPDADAALLAIAERTPALLLLDILLPAQSGIDVVRQLRTLGATFPIVLITVAPERAAELTVHDRVECIAKPFNLNTMLACVERYVLRARTA